MSFGGGFGGFGSNNNQQQSSGFSGFGSGGTSNTGFGGGNTAAAGPFGSGSNSNTGTSLFGNNNASPGGFGSGGFGSSNNNNNNNNSSPFGKSPFGTNTTSSGGGGLFGAGTATSGNTGFGSFGNTNTTTNNASPFGGSSGGGMFGQNKPAFGGGSGTSGGLFGGGGSTGFGSSNTTTGAFGGAGFGSAPTQNTGTGNVPYSVFNEKGTSDYFQHVSAMPNYQRFSPEELRLVDYEQGRKYGNQSGQPGAFGQSTGFGGGFGASNTGSSTFGNNTSGTGGPFGTSNSSPFGGNQPNTGPSFGSNTSGGLFGNKPSSGALFSSNTSTSSQGSGGLFGTSGSNTGGFGSGGFGNNTNTGGGLLGSNQNQSKPAFGGGFGSGSGNAFGSGSGFGSTSNQNQGNTSGSLFGSSNTNNNPFGGGQPQNTSSPFGVFGNNQNNNQSQNQPGQSGGGNVFGFGPNNQNQQKPGGLFGNTNTSGTTGGGLFGTSNNQQPSGGVFGNQGDQGNQQSGNPFGNKPAGTSMFGNNANPGNTGGSSIFGTLGNNQNQPNQGNSLFGNNNNNQQQQKPSLFGPSSTSNTGGLFNTAGTSNTSNTGFGGPLFGNSQQNQQQLQQGSSLFGTPPQNLNQSQQPTSLTTSLTAPNPYGNDQLFASLGTPQQSVGPLITPLSSNQKKRKPSVLPAYKINPSASTRLVTPQKRPPVYGFTYSTYGTPGSGASSINSPPSFSNSLFGARSLGKSYSTSNLRHSFTAEDNILAPGAFSSNGARSANNSGSIKRLNITRNLRTDLFGSDTDSTRKNVSFANRLTNGDTQRITNGEANGETSNALVRVESDDSPTPSAEEQGLLRSSHFPNGVTMNGKVSPNDTPQVRGNELAVVPEDESPPQPTQNKSAARPNLPHHKTQKDQIPGEYWSEPSMDALKKMSRTQLKNITPFLVGRDGVGKIEFSSVDLTTVPLDKIFGDIVQLEIRRASVYSDPATKPPQGKGLNVPSTILLENSWPRAAAGRLPVHEKKGPRFQKHIDRLQRVQNTEFISYDMHTGEWTFNVPHYTTYSLDYDEGSTPSDVLDDPALIRMPKSQNSAPAVQDPHTQDISMLDEGGSSPDDTFQFQKNRKSIPIPGGFSDEIVEDDETTQVEDHQQQSFLGERSVGSLHDGVAEHSEVIQIEDDVDVDGSVSAEEQEMAGSFPKQGHTTEQAVESPVKTKSILKASQLQLSEFGTPKKGPVDFAANWTEQLQRTISPRKQDRQSLRQSQANILGGDLPPQQKAKGRTLVTHTDLMNSLWGQERPPQKRRGQGFEV